MTSTDEKPRDIQAIIHYARNYCEQHNLAEYIKWLTNIYKGIPAEYRASAIYWIDLDNDYGTWTATTNIAFTRPEFPEEIAARIERDKANELQKQRQEEQEYTRLKAKYGETL